MAHNENSLSKLKKEDIIQLYLSLQHNNESTIKKMDKKMDDLTETVKSMAGRISKLEEINEQVNKANESLEDKMVQLERSLHAANQYGRRECLEVVGIPPSITNVELQPKVIEILKMMT